MLTHSRPLPQTSRLIWVGLGTVLLCALLSLWLSPSWSSLTGLFATLCIFSQLRVSYASYRLEGFLLRITQGLREERIALRAITELRPLERPGLGQGLEIVHAGKTVRLWPREYEAFKTALERDLERVRDLDRRASTAQPST